MAKEEVDRLAMQFLRDVERYSGKKISPPTEKELKEIQTSLEEWDKAGRPFDEEENAHTDARLFR